MSTAGCCRTTCDEVYPVKSEADIADAMLGLGRDTTFTSKRSSTFSRWRNSVVRADRQREAPVVLRTGVAGASVTHMKFAASSVLPVPFQRATCG